MITNNTRKLHPKNSKYASAIWEFNFEGFSIYKVQKNINSPGF